MRWSFRHKVRRAGMLLWGAFLTSAVHAQWTVQDSLRLDDLLRGDGEIHLNQDARKSIQLDIPSSMTPTGKPQMDTSKPWMQFVSDLPTSFSDTTRYVLPRYIRLLPFTPFTAWNENPFAAQDALNAKKKWKMTWQISKDRHFEGVIGHPIPAGMDPEIGPGRGGGAGVSVSFNAEKFLYENLTKRGRTLRHNRKHANAWKTYGDAPEVTLQDSILYYKQLRGETETP